MLRDAKTRAGLLLNRARFGLPLAPDRLAQADRDCVAAMEPGE